MIARDSKSYPYLAIAQHYRIDYGEVLKYADWIDPFVSYGPINIAEWKLAVWSLKK